MPVDQTHPREQMRSLIHDAIEKWLQARVADKSLGFDVDELADEILEGIAWPVESD